MTTKEQERFALDQIVAILNILEPDSYVNTAFKGCAEIAKSNIENDFACSIKDAMDSLQQKLLEQQNVLYMITNQNRALHVENKGLKQRIDQLLDWKVLDEAGGISDSDYNALKNSCALPMPSINCISLLWEHGFDKCQVSVLQEAPVYRKNRLGELRQCGVTERISYYYASDYNYILFRCGGYTHALVNGTIHFNI